MPIETRKIPVILFMDPRGVILEGGKGVIQRMQSYASALSKISKDKKIKMVILSSSSKKKVKKIDGNSFSLVNISEPTFNFIKFAIKSRKHLRQENWDVKILIGGDPWESFWAALFLNFLQRSSAPIQVQVHGDIASHNWKKINRRNRIRFHLSRYALLRAGSIRTVSKGQTKLLIAQFNLTNEKFVVVPVPILELEKIPISRNRRPNSIAIIGRVHEDRGIWNFIDLIKSLSSIRDDFRVIIVGPGSSTREFLTQVSSCIPSDRYNYLGVLDQIGLRKVWRSVGVLVSTAPAESYGRAMREALVAGVPVWAMKSSGVEDLISQVGKDAVKILDLKKSNRELSKELDQLLKSKVSLSFRKQFIKDNSTYAQLLAKSWVDLINKQKL
jgi:glycosyltransferase involved in cell wall biosynthesis